MLISKKDLLKQTGISYGQLYRWKREKLIPEEWFIKQPSFTGQETFFPREKILKRISAIQNLKEKYSLEELSRILSPELSDRNFTIENLSEIEEIENKLIPCFVNSFGKNNFTYIELIIMCGLSSVRKDCGLSNEDISEIIKGLKDYIAGLKSTEFLLVIYYDNKHYSAIIPEHTEVYMDKRLSIIKQVRLNDVSSLIKLKYRKSFNFKFEDEADALDPNSMQFSY